MKALRNHGNPRYAYRIWEGANLSEKSNNKGIYQDDFIRSAYLGGLISLYELCDMITEEEM